MFAPSLLLSAALLPAQPGEAEKLLREMNETITAARSLRIEFEVRTPPGFLDFSGGGTQERTLSGVVVLGDRNRFRQELWENGSDQLAIVVSDGKRVGELSSTGAGTPRFRPVPGWHNEVLRSWLGRGGTVLAMHEVGRRAGDACASRPGPEDAPKAVNVRLLRDEEVGGVRCRVVGYDLAWPGGTFRHIRVRVWIDPGTKLPVRREMELTFVRPGTRFDPRPHSGGWSGPAVSRTWTCTATHTRFEIDPELDDTFFKMPTEADLLLARMGARIRGAKSLRVDFEITAPKPLPKFAIAMDSPPSRGPTEFPWRGSVALADRNRFRFELKSADGWTDLAVADGKRTGGRAYPGGPVPPWHNDALRSWLGRGGTLMSAQLMGEYLRTTGGREPGPGVGPVASRARLLPDEELKGVKARVVEYDLTWRGIGRQAPPPALYGAGVDRPEDQAPGPQGDGHHRGMRGESCLHLLRKLHQVRDRPEAGRQVVRAAQVTGSPEGRSHAPR